MRGIDGCYQVCVREKVRKAKRSIISRAPSPAVSLVPATRGVHGPCPEIRDRRRGGGGGGGGGGGTGNDRSGVVKIERADRESQPRELWRAIEPCRAEPRRRVELGRKYTDYSCSLGQSDATGGCSKYGNRGSKSWPEGRRRSMEKFLERGRSSSLRKPRSRNGGVGGGVKGDASLSEHLDLFYAWM